MPRCKTCGTFNNKSDDFCSKCGKVRKESTLLNAFLRSRHKSDLQWRRVRLGKVDNKADARMFAVILRWVDAIVIEEGKVKIIEAKLRPNPTAFGQLDLYEKLFRQTPEFSQLKDRPIEKVFLTPEMDLQLLDLAKEKGITYELFTEEDVKEALE